MPSVFMVVVLPKGDFFAKQIPDTLYSLSCIEEIEAEAQISMPLMTANSGQGKLGWRWSPYKSS